jgi:hypothetical protein
MESNGKEGREEADVSNRRDAPAKTEAEETPRTGDPIEHAKKPYVPPKVILVKDVTKIQERREDLEIGGPEEVDG